MRSIVSDLHPTKNIMDYPSSVRIVEVGPRDGLQNEQSSISVEQKCRLVDHLSDTGIKSIETGSFVSAKWVPQMADSDQVFARINRGPGISYSALTPNLRGFDDAMAAGVHEVAIFAAATETFSQKNLNASIAESLRRFKPVLKKAGQSGIPVRGYLSCVLGCPYEGPVDPNEVSALCFQLLEAGCYEVSLGDTIGTGTAGSMSALLDSLARYGVSPRHLAAHCHDTYGQAIGNILIALQFGISVIDASIAGLGGCPYAKGATGNVATEDVVYLLDGLGISHGVDFERLLTASQYISGVLQRPPESRVAKALLANSIQ